MWQITWALNLIPDSVMHWIINILLIVGIVGTVAGFVIKRIPFVNQYRLLVQIVSILLLVFGVWLKGGESAHKLWKDRVAEMEQKVKESENKAWEASKRVHVHVIERTKVIRENTATLANEATSAITPEINARCEIPKITADRYNRAAQGDAK